MRIEHHIAMGMAGFGLWATGVVLGLWPLAEAYLMLAVLALVPLVLRLMRGESQFVETAWGIAAVSLFASSTISPGIAAGLLALPWVVFTGLLALRGARRLLARGFHDLPEVLLDLGALMLPVGAVWATAWRLDASLLGFQGIWVVLTAVHFHFAAFFLPVTVGGFLRLRRSHGPVAKVAAVAVIGGIPLTAIGIYTNQAVEFLAAASLVVGAVLFALKMLADVRFAVPAVALLGAMVLAGGYATATTFGGTWLDLQQMVRWHGSANALGFVTLSLIALAWLDPRPRSGVADVAFSKLRGNFRIGADFFDRVGATTEGDATGLVDRLRELDGPWFEGADVAPEIADFYERTCEYDLDVEARWKWWFAWAGRIWHRIALRMEQTVFPVGDSAVSNERVVASAILPLSESVDGRPSPRAWVRTFADTGRAMYAAAYSTHHHDGVAYMNIAFPMWRSNMASVLFPLNFGTNGLRLDTETSAARPHAGIWQITNFGPVRLPLREYIDVWMSGDPQVPEDLDPRGAPMVARHVLTAFGQHYLTLDYRIRLRGSAQN